MPVVIFDTFFYLPDNVQKLLEELQQLDMADLYGAFVNKGVSSPNMWSLTKDELKDMGANFMQRKSFEQEKLRRSGNFVNSIALIKYWEEDNI